ncbi:ScbR family autoregulator-binding transcription factor [Streptomyces sp. NRRL S-1022]|uniref:ScbR family autoregulator-binding transcription factor n=1 Tax=Streptomyces sp. NRRL S-1022 TaxID=1463880 RepID=UPI001F1AF841|nr:ScbR family autoregulator-binding transcription factor [Streptomyces sp. NRRL S-1022]
MTVRQPAQARGIATRAEILDVAAILFAEKGYSQTSLQDILDQTGLTKGGLYYHFRTKQEIAVAVVTEGFAMDDTPPQAGPLQAVVDASIVLAWLTPQVPVVQAAARLATDQDHKDTFGYLWSQYIPRVTQLLEEAKRREELKPGVKPDETSWVWVAAYTGVDLMCRLDYAALPRKVAEMNLHFVAGIATERTLAELDMTVERGRELLRRSPWAAEYLDKVAPRTSAPFDWHKT